jgi:hypothetical protein
MDKETEDFLKKVGDEKEANPEAMLTAKMLSEITKVYCGFVDNALRTDKDTGIVLIAMINSGIIRANSNSTDEAIASINQAADKMKEMVIQLERGVNGLPIRQIK